MPQFMLLLHTSTTAPRDLPREQVQAVIGRYVAWSNELRKTGRLVAGEKLKDEGGRVLRREGAKVVVRDGPFAEARELIGGFYIITARDHDEAVELARGCPHVELGGTVELREIEQVSR